jgi:hypothetical protein
MNRKGGKQNVWKRKTNSRQGESARSA